MKSICRYLLLFPFALGMIDLACRGTLPGEPDTDDKSAIKNSWRIYTPFDWPHDGQPVAGPLITVYSDGAGLNLKQEVHDLASAQLQEIMDAFQFDRSEDFLFPPGYDGIDIYINRFYPDNIAWAYWGGFLITLRTEPLDARWQRYLIYTSKHELVHVFEFLIEGKPDLPADVWFKEGIAVHMADPEKAGFNLIDTIGELDAWIERNRDDPDLGNPIAIHLHSDFPPDADRTYYYITFELALRYLLDDRGGNCTYADILGLMYDQRGDVPFSRAFEDNFGISLDRFEAEFYSRTRQYLQQIQF